MEAANGEAAGLSKPPKQMAVPRWSPDGAQLACIGGLMSDEASIGGEIYVVPAMGGDARNLTPDRKSSPSWLAWTAAKRILSAESEGGSSALSTLDTGRGHAERLWRGDE